MALKYGSTGKRVEALQQALVWLGYALPKWGVDGDLGQETWNAIRSYCFDRGKSLADAEPGAELSQDLHDEILAVADAFATPSSPSEFVDVTGLHPGKQRKGPRPWTQIKAIVLHQTGVLLGPKPTRWYTVAAHLGVPQNGQIILINPLTELLWHGNSLNKSSVGIEISGNFEGIDGDPSKYWKPGGGPHRATTEQIQAARKAVKWICKVIGANGGSVRYIHAHRQSSMDRRADPGSRVWQEVGLWAQRTLDLTDRGPSYAPGGYPIPTEWDSTRTDAY